MIRERQAVDLRPSVCAQQSFELPETRVRAPESNVNHRDDSSERSQPNRRQVGAWEYVISLVLLVIAANSIGSAGASAYSQRLSQYSHTVWRVQDGLFNQPNAIAQSPDGYLWIGTKAGLVRFDGVQFVPQNDYAGSSLSESSVEAVAAGADGSIWIGMPGSVFRISSGILTRYPVNGRVNSLRPDESGAVWVFETRTRGDDGPVVKIEGGAVTHYPRPVGSMRAVQAVEKKGDNQFWLGSADGLCDWSPARPARCFLHHKLEPFKGLAGITAIHASSDGTLWVGIARAGPGLGLGKLVNEQWVPVDIPGLKGDSLEVSSLLEDRTGSLWIGTINNGIFRVRSGVAEHFGKADGLSDDEVIGGGILEDRHGNIWVLTASGLDQFRERSVSVFSTREGLPANGVESVLARHNGTVWIGNTKLTAILRGISVPVLHPELYGEKAVTSMFEDHASSLWIGLDRTLSVVDDESRSEISASDGADIGIVTGIVEDVDDDIWVLIADASPRLLRVRSRKVVAETDVGTFGLASSLTANPAGGVVVGFSNGIIRAMDKMGSRLIDAGTDHGEVVDIAFGSAGELTVASTTGLYVQLASDAERLKEVPGLPCHSLISAVWDTEARLWLNSTCGIIEIQSVDWNHWLGHTDQNMRTTLYDVTDGAEPGASSFRPRSSVASDGTVWFATGSVAESVDPARTGLKTAAPDVMVEEITADQVSKRAVDGIQLPSGTRDIDIRYTAIAFAAPRKTKFRYRLEGRDDVWQEAGTRRQAFFTDLSPGQYTFEAKATSAAGKWGEQPARFRFTVLPAYYQTRWFAALCGLAAIGFLYLAYVLRLRQVASQLKRRHKVESDERERIARQLHDTLLQDTQALVFTFQTVADDLPRGTPIRERIEGALDRADRVLAEGRECVLDLRSQDALPTDLPNALARVGDELSNGRPQTFRSITEGTPQPLDPIVRDEIYRIAREAMVNAFRHGDASAVEVQLIFAPELLTVQIRDDGKGIDQETLLAGGREGHWGLKGMRERASRIGGHLEIWSGTNPGTEVQLEIPARSAYRSLRAPGWSWIARLGIGGR